MPTARDVPEDTPLPRLYRLLSEAAHADAVRREQFYSPLLAELKKPGAFPTPLDFFSFVSKQEERLKVELGDTPMYESEKRFLNGLLVAAAVLVLNLKPMEALAAYGGAFWKGRQGRRRDLLNRELEKLLALRTDLTVDDVFNAFNSYYVPDAIVGADESTVDWHDRSGKVHKTTREGIKKRLQRLRKASPHT